MEEESLQKIKREGKELEDIKNEIKRTRQTILWILGIPLWIFLISFLLVVSFSVLAISEIASQFGSLF